MTPYSALAGGRLSKHPGETSKRLEEDSYAKFKYDATAQQDGVIIGRVAELAEQHGVTMTEISLAWLLQKVTAPVVGATKLHHIEGAAKAVELELSPQEMAYLEEPTCPQAGGRDGPKHPSCRRDQAGMDCKVKRRNLACLIFRGKTRNSRSALSTSPLTKW